MTTQIKQGPRELTENEIIYVVGGFSFRKFFRKIFKPLRSIARWVSKIGRSPRSALRLLELFR